MQMNMLSININNNIQQQQHIKNKWLIFIWRCNFNCFPVYNYYSYLLFIYFIYLLYNLININKIQLIKIKIN